MRKKRFAESKTLRPRLEIVRSSPDLERQWPSVEDELFAALAAYFEGIRKRLTEASGVEERAALVGEIESIIRYADAIIERRIRVTLQHCQFISRRLQEQGIVR